MPFVFKTPKLQILTKWFPRRKTRAVDTTSDARRCDWRDLSPDRPPLPFFLPPTPSSTSPNVISGGKTTGSAPIPERQSFVFSQAASSGRPPTNSLSLYTIFEETDDTMAEDAQPQSPQLPYKVIRRSLSNSSSSSSSSSCYHDPYSQDTPPSFQPDIVGDETKCKRKFSKMVQKAYLLQVEQKNDAGKGVKVEFDENDNLDRVVLPSGQSMKCENPQYIPPEAALNNAITRLADVWVLGVSLYRMLVGKDPFSASNDRKLFKKMLNADFTIPSQFSEDVKDLLRRMLAPAETRASLDLVMFHPWLKPYRIVVPDQSSPPSQPAPSPPPSPESRKRRRDLSRPVANKRRKVKGGLVRVVRFLLRGPYPPPKHPYRELAHLGRHVVL